MQPSSCHVRHGRLPLEAIELRVIDGEESYAVKADVGLACCAGKGLMFLTDGVWKCSLSSRLARLSELRKSYQTLWERELQLSVSDQARDLVDQSVRDGKGYRLSGKLGEPTALLWEIACALIWYHGVPVYVGRLVDGLTRPQDENAVVLVDGFSGQKLGALEVMVSWCYGACLPFWLSETQLSSKTQQNGKAGRYAQLIRKETTKYRQKPWYEKSSDMSLKRKLLSVCHADIVT